MCEENDNDPLKWKPNPSSGVYDFDDVPVDPRSVLGGGVEYRSGSDISADGGCLMIFAVWTFIFACLGAIYLVVRVYIYLFG
ncbi:MAG: hypothetical protein PHW31_04535 [Candidatus Pacebacteria bacterium]|nr:hypothetical protein [Candidatus Paceibacterota bacterium]